jgi:hypothetical protein
MNESENGGSANPYVFLVGCPRSGTTLLQRIVDSHPDIALFHEFWWIDIWYRRRTGLRADDTVTPDLVTALLDYPKFPKKMGMSRGALERALPSFLDGDRPPSFSAFMSRVFDLYGEHTGKRLVGDKTPRYVQRIALLHGLWPRARFVHLIRDAREVVLSLLNWNRNRDRGAGLLPVWDRDPVSTAALWWEMHVRDGRAAGQALDPRLYRELRYDALVSTPEKTCRELCRFLDLPFDDSMLEFHVGRTLSDPGLDAKDAWLPITPGLRRWRQEMSPDELERCEAVAGDLLAELGYERTCEPSRAAVERGAAIRHAFEHDVARKRRRKVAA